MVKILPPIHQPERGGEESFPPAIHRRRIELSEVARVVGDEDKIAIAGGIPRARARFGPDSLLEGSGFEPPVPPGR
jgi:hypothetical protein